MDHSLNMRKRLLIVLAILFSAVARGTTTTNNDMGYSFDLPAGWIPIPSNEIYRTMNQVTRNGAQSASFCAGYQRDSAGGRYFVYPYVLIQIIPYPDGQSINSVSERDLRKAVASITGASEDEMHKAMSDTAANLVQNIRFPRRRISRAHRDIALRFFRAWPALAEFTANRKD